MGNLWFAHPAPAIRIHPEDLKPSPQKHRGPPGGVVRKSKSPDRSPSPPGVNFMVNTERFLISGKGGYHPKILKTLEFQRGW